jgi:WD40 repeat protein
MQRNEIALWLLCASTMCVVGCSSIAYVQCDESSVCDLHPGGMCMAAPSGNMWCTYPDSSCTSGYRYSDFQTGDGVAGVCVPTDAGSGPGAACKQSVAFEGTVYMLQGETSEIWISNLDGTQPINVSNSPAQDIQPDWSPSGTRIAFASSRNGEANPLRYDIYVVGADGSNLTNLTLDSQDNNIHPHWSPDGTRIAFLRNSVVWVMNANGSGASPVTTQLRSEYLAWSPTGNQLVLDDFNPSTAVSNGLYVVTVGDSSLPKKLTTLTGTEGNPRWNPSSRISFSYQLDLYSVNPDGSDLQNITKDARRNDDIQAIADLKVIGFDSDHGNGGPEIWVRSNEQNSQLTHNTQGSGEIFYASDISRDGKFISFKHRKIVETNPDGNIWEIGVVSADGGVLHMFNAPYSSIADGSRLAPCSN